MADTARMTGRAESAELIENISGRFRESRAALYGIGGAIALGLVWYLVVKSGQIKAQRAEQALANAQRMLVQPGKEEQGKKDLAAVVQRYSGTRPGTIGRMMLAQMYFDQGKADSGLAVLGKENPTGPGAAPYAAALGAGYEYKKDYAKAAEAYVKASDASGAKTFERAAYRIDAARAYASAGNVAEAKKLLEGLATDPAGLLADEAKLRLGELLARGSTKPVEAAK